MFEQVKLSYSFAALEPHIDALTMETHYSKHHATYTKNFNAADAAGALGQGEGCCHRHGAGAASKHEENQHVLRTDGQDRGNAGGQAHGRECGGGFEQDDVERIVRH